MKNYNHLWEQFISDDNYYLAIHNATQHKSSKKKKKRIIQYYRAHQEELKDSILAYAQNFINHKHTPKEIYDGIRRKKRTILVPDMDEQIIHHMIVNVLKPIILRPMYYHSYGSLPGRGAMGNKKKKTRSGVDAVRKYIKKHPDKCTYYLKLDIKKFFENISHTVLKEQLARTIHDMRFLQLLYTLIDAVPGEVGIPLGFYTSQWLANYYLISLDHYIKEQLHASFYIRYMDDIVIFSDSKEQLHNLKIAIEQYLTHKLHLALNPKWHIVRFTSYNFLDFMGFRFYPTHITLRRTLVLRAMRKAKHIYKKIYPTIYDCRQMLAYKGWFAFANCRQLYLKHIQLYISFPTLQKYISLLQRGDINVVSYRKWRLPQAHCA